MQSLITILSNLRKAYCTPYYSIHQRHIILLALLGAAGTLAFLVFRGFTLGYWGDMASRSLAIFGILH